MNNDAMDALLHVVVIGASAGGLQALADLVSQLRPSSRAAFVIAQHLSPDHSSQLVSLLKRASALPVEAASDRMPLQAGQILVIPPNTDARIEAGLVQLEAPKPRFGPSPSLDVLFDSQARACGEGAVAVVLSGTGSDGAFGLRAVGAHGGLILVQSPESAQFDAMPTAAIALGHPDLVADPKTLGARLSEWFSDGEHWRLAAADRDPSVLATAVNLLKQSAGIDFSQYRESTLLRQVERRMAVQGIKTIAAYNQLLSSDQAEARALMQNLLVTVTSFFRNKDGFDVLSRHLNPRLAAWSSNRQYRVWVPGCATGEEAYSIAMLISEAMGHPPDLSQRLKVFATDIDEQSLEIARRASYPASALRSIPDALQERFINSKDTSFDLAKSLRACVVFAKHNICVDPPFPEIDLISCRNLLIYFTPALQQRVIDLLSFSLHPGSLLFLGSSESLGQMTGFRIVDPSHRLFERTQQPRTRFRPSSESARQSPVVERPHVLVASVRDSLPNQQQIQLLDALIRVFAKPCLVVDRNHTLVQVIGDVSPYCRMPEGRWTGAAIRCLREDLQAEARTLFLLVRADGTPVRSRDLHLANLPTPLTLEAAPIQVGGETLTVLSFLQGVPTQSSARPVAEEQHVVFALEIERLERELLTSQDTLRCSLTSLEHANEELEASSEELQASAEELQSSNEELEASNEELRATNDELGRLNQQLRIRSEELESVNTDLENIQRSLNQGMVIVDLQLRVVRFSPLAVRVFGLVDADIGQPLVSVPTMVPIPELKDSLVKVIVAGERCNLEATSEDLSYFVQLMPYRNAENQILGAIITLTDVSELTALRRAADESSRDFTTLAEALDQTVWKRDHSRKRLLYVSDRALSLTGCSAAELCAAAGRFDDLIVPAERARVIAVRESAERGWDLTFSIACRNGQVKTLREVAIVLETGTQGSTSVGTWLELTPQPAPLGSTSEGPSPTPAAE
ncbi:MAG: chemotaxis protein CheB [Cyanobacteriota bacterium]|nr:chemotaxis protein CheB [Cyanobacteriota bacterium]